MLHATLENKDRNVHMYSSGTSRNTGSTLAAGMVGPIAPSFSFGTKTSGTTLAVGAESTIVGVTGSAHTTHRCKGPEKDQPRS